MRVMGGGGGGQAATAPPHTAQSTEQKSTGHTPHCSHRRVITYGTHAHRAQQYQIPVVVPGRNIPRRPKGPLANGDPQRWSSVDVSTMCDDRAPLGVPLR
jgi:hypothetical protein